MKRWLSMRLAGSLLIAGLFCSAPAFALGLDPAFPKEPAIGPVHAKGVVVWSHGRSINAEDYKSATPVYLQALRQDGWEVLRFDRLAAGDTLDRSGRRLAAYAGQLKREGYQQVVVAGQSFGGFVSLIAADESADVDAVIATAPAAYGDFQDFYDSWRLNATKLYPLLAGVKRARVMVFYFHDDDFDPGGRGPRSQQILSQRGLGYAVIDQPANFTTHWAASSGLFLRRFGDCIRDFADDRKLAGRMVCTPSWGTMPSAQLKLPAEFADAGLAHPEDHAATATGSGNGQHPGRRLQAVRDVWYGFYPNGREVLLGVEAVHGKRVTAVYAIGPSIDDKFPSTWTRRRGRIDGDRFVFEQHGKSTLHFRPTQDGGLAATWISATGDVSMEAHLKPIDPRELAARERAGASAPVTSAAAHGDGNQAEN
jgi:pimeloyl-ACP methyl ester carboxylesterase